MNKSKVGLIALIVCGLLVTGFAASQLINWAFYDNLTYQEEPGAHSESETFNIIDLEDYLATSLTISGTGVSGYPVDFDFYIENLYHQDFIGANLTLTFYDGVESFSFDYDIGDIGVLGQGNYTVLSDGFVPNNVATYTVDVDWTGLNWTD